MYKWSSIHPSSNRAPLTTSAIMSDLRFLSYVDLACILVALTVLKRLIGSKSARPAAPLPPGPKGLPVLGNLFDMPSRSIWETYSKWAKDYGDIVSVQALGQTFVILNSAEVAVKMLETKGVTYSDRPVSNMLQLIGWDSALAFTSPGQDTFKRQRTHFQRLLGTPPAIKQFHPSLESEAQKFLKKVTESSDVDVQKSARYATGSIMLKIAYGYTATGENDRLIDLAERTIAELLEAGNPATWMVDFIPTLAKLPAWFPGAGFQKKIKVWHRNMLTLVNSPIQFVQEQINAGTSVPSFASTLLEGNDLTPDEENSVKWAAMSMYSAGEDTTTSAISGFFLAMLLHPDVLAKAQEEIDRVIGQDRLPTISDRAQLPYLNAVTMEVFRWHAVTPIGVAHKALQDDIHEGYFIPKDAIIIAHSHYMSRDPRVYRDPHLFNPDRFLGDKPEPDPRTFAFGFGRRICPGRYIADTFVFTISAMSVAAFNIHKKVVDGVPIEPTYKMTSGIISYPEPYEISITPRSSKASELIDLAE